jgi:hypothetical protein
LILLALGFLLSLVQDLPELGGPRLPQLEGRALSLIHQALFVAAEICLWLALTRSLSEPPNWSAGFYTLVALNSSLAAVPTVLTPDRFLQLVRQPVAGLFLHWGRFVAGIALQLLVLGLLRRLLQGGAAATAQPAAATPGVTPPPRDIAVGAACLGAGLLVTFVSYSSAAGGGRYVVATGAIAYGLARLIRGFVRM